MNKLIRLTLIKYGFNFNLHNNMEARFLSNTSGFHKNAKRQSSSRNRRMSKWPIKAEILKWICSMSFFLKIRFDLISFLKDVCELLFDTWKFVRLELGIQHHFCIFSSENCATFQINQFKQKAPINAAFFNEPTIDFGVNFEIRAS